MTTIETLRDERAKLETAIRVATAKAIGEFKDATGLTPRSISIDMVGFDQVGAERQYMIGQVSATVDV